MVGILIPPALGKTVSKEKTKLSCVAVEPICRFGSVLAFPRICRHFIPVDTLHQNSWDFDVLNNYAFFLDYIKAQYN
jgi:hypothetical protein